MTCCAAKVEPAVLTVTAASPPSSAIVAGLTDRVSSGAASSSVIVRATSSGARRSAPLDSSPLTWMVLSGVSTLLFTAVMVTVPVLSVALAAKLRIPLVLREKSASTAGESGAADTVTVKGVSEAVGTVAVTVLLAPFSEIESGVRVSVTRGLSSTRHTLTQSSSS